MKSKQVLSVEQMKHLQELAGHKRWEHGINCYGRRWNYIVMGRC